MIQDLFKYAPFNKIRVSPELASSDISCVMLENGIIDLSIWKDDNEIKRILEDVTIAAIFCHSDINIVNQVNSNSIYKIRHLINNDNFDDVIGDIHLRGYELLDDYVIDLESLDDRALMILQRIKDVKLNKYYSTRVWDNVFIDFNNYEKVLTTLKVLEYVNRNNCYGTVKCNECEAYGICNILPKATGSVRNIIANQERCKLLIELATPISERYMSAEAFSQIMSAVSKDVNILGGEMANNNVMINGLTSALLKVLSHLNKGDDSLCEE